MSNNKISLSEIKLYISLLIATATILLSSVFWIQNYCKENYYSIQSGIYIEEEHKEFKDEINKIREQNIEIILMLGRIEGELKND